MAPKKKATKKAAPIAAKCRIRRQDDDGEDSGYPAVFLSMVCGRKTVGQMTAEQEGDVLKIIDAQSTAGRGARVGTRLYQRMADIACTEGWVLESDRTRSAMANGFWLKQYDKGRADFFFEKRGRPLKKKVDPHKHFAEIANKKYDFSNLPPDTFFRLKKCLNNGKADLSALGKR